ncbi:MAG: glycogen debranching protein GlgX [Armatimonadota bacterium]|nr:glycogen debranching protein GlgX [Armatimonadota bacterium]
MKVWRGAPTPLGATWDGLGVNFAVYSERAEAVTLVLFEGPDDPAGREVPLSERTGPIWHGYVPGLGPGQLYGYRVHGPYRPHEGLRFNARKVLLDPYARAVGRPLRWHDSLYGYVVGHPDADLSLNDADSAPYAPLGAVVDDAFAWGDDRPPRVPWEDTIIYETHVKGLTALHPEVPPHLRGTYLGVAAEPIVDHLTSLGITTVELLPVQAFVQDRRLVEHGLRNYWGYTPLAYFAPEPTYAAGGGLAAVREFKTMVRALHAAGLEVILDVVYNHTGEGDHLGPTLAFRGLDNAAYYKLADDRRFYVDYTGTGNTLDAGNPYVVQLIVDSLRYWVQEMHVDGFRFDLAPVLAREARDVDMRAAVLQALQHDPVLSRVKLIAEPWDLGPGGYQVGHFPWPWAEWNGRYRDAVRRFWRGDEGTAGEFATRVTGSADLYARAHRRPCASVNYVTAHDGFTLEDLVSYERKHNEANLEDNRDGTDANYSVNCGHEGPTDAPAVLACRETLKRSLVVTLCCSLGVPMLLGGDELSRTQRGNNNAYCQDNPVSWYHWTLDHRQRAFLEFVRAAVAFRKGHPTFRRRTFLTGAPTPGGYPDVLWVHPDGRTMTPDDWAAPGLRALGMLLPGGGIADTDARGRRVTDATVLVLFNAGRARRFVLPEPPDAWGWELVLSSRPGHARRRVALPPGHRVILGPRQAAVLQAIPPR